MSLSILIPNVYSDLAIASTRNRTYMSTSLSTCTFAAAVTLPVAAVQTRTETLPVAAVQIHVAVDPNEGLIQLAAEASHVRRRLRVRVGVVPRAERLRIAGKRTLLRRVELQLLSTWSAGLFISRLKLADLGLFPTTSALRSD